MKRTLLVSGVLLLGCLTGYRPAAGQSQSHPLKPAPAPGTPAATQREILDRYCVTCHNDRLKTAGLTLQNLDLAGVGDHAELWEKVVRKLRAGLMPPPGVRRPPLPEYEALRNYLEAEIDRKAAGRMNPGSIVMH